MRRRLFLQIGLLGGTLVLAACGGRLNPFNWFKRKPRVTVEEAYALPEDTRGLIERLSDVAIEETRTGIILRATGIAATQGWSDAELVGQPLDEKGVKTFEFRATAPLGAAATGPERSRAITAAAAISLYQLGQMSAIRVVAAQNAMVARP